MRLQNSYSGGIGTKPVQISMLHVNDFFLNPRKSHTHTKKRIIIWKKNLDGSLSKHWKFFLTQKLRNFKIKLVCLFKIYIALTHIHAFDRTLVQCTGTGMSAVYVKGHAEIKDR